MGEPSGLPSPSTWRVPLEVSISSAPSTFSSASSVLFVSAIAFRTSSTMNATSRASSTFTQRLTETPSSRRCGVLAGTDAELVGPLGQRLDDQRDVLVGVHPELVH